VQNANPIHAAPLLKCAGKHASTEEMEQRTNSKE